MDRCPNCGVPVRSGAKFCTTCGFRLPETASATPEAPDATSTGVEHAPFATAPQDTASPATADQGAEPAGAAGDAAAGSADAAGWFAAASSWPGGWDTAGAPSAESGAAGSETPVESPASAFAAESTGSEPATERRAGQDGTFAEAAAPVAMPVAAPEPSVADDAGPQTSDGAGDPLTRAQALVDELRELLPAVAASTGGRTAPNGVAIAAELEVARRQPDATRTREFEALKAALDHARDRPRDIDTVLDLVGRIDVVLALQEAHDRYGAAIDRAIAALRAGRVEPGDR